MVGIIIKRIGGFYYVKTADNQVYECKARGIFRKEKIKPTIGDEVELSPDGTSIEKINTRKNFLVRPPVANIDMLVIVSAAAEPEPNLFLIDKMIFNVETRGIEAVICINKTDLASGIETERIYRHAGYKTVRVSVLKNDGIDTLKEMLRGKITAFAGLSGVGKSSLLNAVCNMGAQTGSVSEKLRRGRHTTRHVELFEIGENSFVLDTPGFSSFEIDDVNAEDVWRYFPEMADVGGECRFRGCSHINEPDCKVKEKLAESAIETSRYESYREIYKILKEKKDWQRR